MVKALARLIYPATKQVHEECRERFDGCVDSGLRKLEVCRKGSELWEQEERRTSEICKMQLLEKD